MITERWSEADDLLLSSEELRHLLPQQVARICQGVDKVQFDQVVVLSRLLDLPFIRQRLKVLVAETLITELCEWFKVPHPLSCTVVQLGISCYESRQHLNSPLSCM